MKALVVVEHDNQKINPATLHAVTAAKQLSDTVDVLIAGNRGAVVEALQKVSGISEVLYVETSHPFAETLAMVLAELKNSYAFYVAASTGLGKDLMPRLAALLDVAQVSDVIQIVSQDTFVRPIYAGNALATVQSSDPIKVLTIRPTAFPAQAVGTGSASVKKLEVKAETTTRFVEQKLHVSERPELSSAKRVVSGGRALKSKENFALIEQLAKQLNAAVGASRAAVDAGYVPNDYQVGQTGKVVAPELYIAVGISGAIQHLAGMKDSKVIVAINKDPDAPIFQVADYGLVGDLFEIIPALCQELEKINKA